MPGHTSSLGWTAAIGALSLFVCCGAAIAQGAPPPPAVSVTPVVSRQVTETGDFIGRVTAIDKVDIVARVAGLHRGAKFHRRAEGQDRRSPVPHRTGDLQGGGRAAARQSRQGKGDGGQHRAAIAARPGARPQSEHPAIHARPARGRRGRGAGQGDGGAGAARPGGNQSRLYRDPLAHRRTDRTCHLHRRQPGQSLVRDAWRRSSARIPST